MRKERYLSMRNYDTLGLEVKKNISAERYRAKQIARDLFYDRIFPNYARDIDRCETIAEISTLMARMRRKAG